MRITFLTQYWPPEVGAPQGRMYELAKRLVGAGHKVSVVTGFPNYPTGVIHEGYRGRRSMEEEMDGIRILRTWVFATPNRGFFKRILNHFSFTFSCLTAIRKLGPTDAIYVQSPPLFLGFGTLIYSAVKRAPFLFNVSDIWPQSAIEVGMLRDPVAIWMAEAFERLIYRKAARIAVPVPGMIDRLAARGIPREKLVLLSNGVDTEHFSPGPADQKLAKELGLDSRKVFLFAGTHGLAQGLDVILDAAKLTDDAEILYVLAGEGASKAALVERAEKEGITNVRFLSNQPRSAMPSLLNLAYATVITLKRGDFFRSTLPVKMYESMAAGKPIVGALVGAAAELITTAGCGVLAEPEDPQSVVKAVTRLAADPEEARRMGELGRDYVFAHYNRDDIARRLEKVLMEMCQERRR